MTSTTLKYKSNFAPALLKTFKRRIIDMLAVLAAAVIIPVIALVITFSDYVMSTYKGELNMTDEATALIYAIAVICGFFALSCAPKMFSEIYKKQSCDLYFSTPIKREVYFGANYLYGFAVITAGFLLTSLIFNITVPLISNQKVTFTIDWSAYLQIAVPVFLAVISIYSIFILCAVTAGRRIHYLLLCFIGIICSSTFISGFVIALNSIWGMSVNAIIPSSLNPIENAICVILNDSKNTILLAVISVVEIAVFFIAGLIIFKRRRAEVAEVSLTGRIVPYVFLAILAGAAFMYGSFTNSVIITIIVGLILVTLMTMAFTGIFYKKVFTKQTGITALCIFVVCSLFMGFVYLPSYSTFVKKLPDAENVESVEIYDLAYNSEFSGFIGSISNNILLNYDLGDTIKITSEQGIADAIALHQKLIDDKTIDASQQNRSTNLFNYMFDDYYYDYYSTYDCKIVYNLKSGKTMTRTYSAPSGYLISEFITLMKNEEAINQISPFNIKKENILFADFERYDYNAEEDYIDYSNLTVNYTMNADECIKFIDAYKRDLLQMDGTRFIENLNYPFYVDYGYITDTITSEAENDITIYYINDDVPEDIRQKYLSMSPAEIRKQYNNNFDGAYDYVDYYPITTEYIYVNSYNTQAFDYINSVSE